MKTFEADTCVDAWLRASAFLLEQPWLRKAGSFVDFLAHPTILAATRLPAQGTTMLDVLAGRRGIYHSLRTHSAGAYLSTISVVSERPKRAALEMLFDYRSIKRALFGS